MSDPASTLPSCLACGACCFSRRSDYVRVTGADHARLGDDAERLTHFEGSRCFMRMEDGHCAALIVDPVRGEHVCGIYEKRPDTCRTLERGSPACDAERLGKAGRAVAALARAREVTP